MRQPPGPDLEVIPVDGDAAPSPPRRLAGVGAAIAVAVVAAATGFVIGRTGSAPASVRPPVVNGVLWACHGTVAGNVRFSGLPAEAFAPYADPRRNTYPPPEFGLPIVGSASLADHLYLPSSAGEIVIPVVAVDAGRPERLQFALRRNDGASAAVRLVVPVVRC